MSPFPIIFPSAARAVDVSVGGYVRNSDLIGNADGKKFIMSAWFRPDTDNSTELIYDTDAQVVSLPLTKQSSNKFEVRIAGTDGADVCRFRTVNTYLQGSWHHVVTSADMAVTGARHLVVNGTSDISVVKFIDAVLDLTADLHTVGDVTGCLTEVYVNLAEYLDVTVAANLEKFRTPEGLPADLGSDGSEPTGTAPLIYMRGGLGEFLVNRGSGGDFDSTPSNVTDCRDDPF